MFALFSRLTISTYPHTNILIVLIYQLGKGTRKNLGDTERNEEEMESLMSTERDRTLAGIYLIYCHIALSITEFSISGSHPWIEQFFNFFFLLCKLHITSSNYNKNNQNTTTSTINEMNQRISRSIKNYVVTLRVSLAHFSGNLF